MQKKGQAAMEFLMTYGWAILAAVIAIGVLAYFGVFSPQRYVSELCILSAPFGCDDDTDVSDTIGVSLIVLNGGGEQYNITDVDISNCGTNSTDVIIDSGELLTLGVDCTAPGVVAGAQFRSNIEITYRTIGGARDLRSTGNMVRKEVAA